MKEQPVKSDKPVSGKSATSGKPTASGKWSDTPRRVLTILIGLPIVLGAVAAGRPVATIILLGAGMIAALEMNQMVHSHAILRLPIVVILTLLAGENAYGLLLIGLVLALAYGVYDSYGKGGAYFVRDHLFLLAGALYVGIPIGLLMPIRNSENGLAWIVLLLVCTWATDIFALVGGRFWGKNKLAPTISPGKTIEGAFVGYSAGVFTGIIAMWVLNLPPNPAFFLALVTPFLTEMGDLLESWVKRYYKVKDSGSILPGHGGMLDRIDGLLLSTPVFFAVLYWTGFVAYPNPFVI